MLSRFLCSIFGHKLVSTVPSTENMQFRCVRCEDWIDITRFI